MKRKTGRSFHFHSGPRKENSGAPKPKLVLPPYRLEGFLISEPEVVGLNGSDPDVFGDGYVQTSTDAYSREFDVPLAMWVAFPLQPGVNYRNRALHRTGLARRAGIAWLETYCGTHTAYTVKERLRPVLKPGMRSEGCLPLGSTTAEKSRHTGTEKPAQPSIHPRQPQPPERRVCVHLAEGDIVVDGVGRPLGQPGRREQRKQRVDEDTGQLVQRLSY